MFNIQKRMDGRMLKGIWLLKEVLTFDEVVQLQKEVCVIDKENLMISYNSEDNIDGCFPLVNDMIS